MFPRTVRRTNLQFIFAVSVFINCYIFLINKVSYDNQLSYKSSGKSDEKRIDWHDYKFMLYEAARVGPGENGAPHKLTNPIDIESNERGHKEEGFATIVSDQISPNRSLPDVRLEV